MVATHSSDTVAAAYSNRAEEYVDLFGTMASVHPADRNLVLAWSRGLTGPVLDAGCGPGHWTRMLAEHGLEVSGVDMSATFVEHARRQFPDSRFRVGDIGALDVEDRSLGGILSWYSTIHHPPAKVREPLAEFARVVRPGGGLLLGFFEWPEVGPFDHAVVTAYRWSVGDLTREVDAAGFEIVETHTRTDPGWRPHGAMIARRR